MAFTVQAAPKTPDVAKPRRSTAGVPVSVIVATAVVGAIVLGTLAAPLLTPGGYDLQALTQRFAPPSSSHPLGTDELGRDVLARVLYGGRAALTVTVLATLVATAVGVAAALSSVVLGRAWETLAGRLADIQLSIPTILLALTILAFAGNGTVQLVIVLSLGGWVLSFRVVRAKAAGTIDRPFVDAARVAGSGRLGLLWRHVGPACLPLIVVATTLNFSSILVLESSLGYLGLGIQPPVPDWGQMVASGQAQLATAWWISLFPGAVIVALVVGVQVIGDWLSDRLSTVSKRNAS